MKRKFVAFDAVVHTKLAKLAKHDKRSITKQIEYIIEKEYELIKYD